MFTDEILKSPLSTHSSKSASWGSQTETHSSQPKSASSLDQSLLSFRKARNWLEPGNSCFGGELGQMTLVPILSWTSWESSSPQN